MIGLGGVGIAGVVTLVLIAQRLSGITSLNSIGVAALFLGMISAVAGINIFALGITFNYLVALFYKKPIKQGLFGKPIFKTPLDQQFGWMGMAAMAAGLVVGLVSLFLGLQGWALERLWFYLLGIQRHDISGRSIQLIVYWLLLRILEELSQRELLTRQDLDR